MEQIALDLTEKPAVDHGRQYLGEIRVIEPFLDMLRLFGKRDNEGILYALAAVRSLLLETPSGGIFTQAEMLRILRWMDEERRQSVLDDLRHYNLVQVRDQFYEIPERVVRMLNGLVYMTAPEAASLIDILEQADAYARLDEAMALDEPMRVRNIIQNLVAPLRRLHYRFEQANRVGVMSGKAGRS